MFCTARSFMNLLLQHNMKKASLQINLFRDKKTSMSFSQSAINNFQSHYQTNIMEMTLLLHLMMISV